MVTNMKIRVLDSTQAHGIPTVICLATGDSLPSQVFGAGSGLDFVSAACGRRFYRHFGALVAAADSDIADILRYRNVLCRAGGASPTIQTRPKTFPGRLYIRQIEHSIFWQFR